MDERTFREQFEVGEDEISEKWAIIQSIFKVPSPQEGHDYEAWPRFPASVIQESCSLALLGEDPFVSEFEFNMFRKVLFEADQSGFMVLVRYGSGADKQYELFCYPTDIAWATFNDDNPASQAIALSVLDHYVNPSCVLEQSVEAQCQHEEEDLQFEAFGGHRMDRRRKPLFEV